MSKYCCEFCNKEYTHKRWANIHTGSCTCNPINHKYCVYCNKPTPNGGKFCNHSCSAKHVNKSRTVDRSYMTTEWKHNIRCKVLATLADREFITPNCKKRYFNSKNERAIVNHIKTNHANDEWKSGGRVKISDDLYISRDLWSDRLKVCVEYDGIWHFKDIHGQLAKKQKKDAALEVWCEANGYRLIRVDELKFNSVEQIEDLIYNRSDSIIKVGDRY